MILYIENLKVSMQKQLELINEFSQYKINIQKFVVSQHTKLNIRKRKINT